MIALLIVFIDIYSRCACSGAPGCFEYLHKCQKFLLKVQLEPMWKSYHILQDLAGHKMCEALELLQHSFSLFLVSETAKRGDNFFPPLVASFFRTVCTVAAALRFLNSFLCWLSTICLSDVASISANIEGKVAEIQLLYLN